MSSGRSEREPDDERADGDSAGVYFISVEDFEARKKPPVRAPPEDPLGGASSEERWQPS